MATALSVCDALERFEVGGVKLKWPNDVLIDGKKVGGVLSELHTSHESSQHAVIHEDIPRIPNVGYLVGGRFFTPGDALTVPDADVEVLGLPTAAPWLKLSEAVGLLRTIAPRLAFPVHDAVLAQPQIWYGQFDALKPAGTAFEAVPPDGVRDLS